MFYVNLHIYFNNERTATICQNIKIIQFIKINKAYKLSKKCLQNQRKSRKN
jgi:hypothetical protein